MTHNPCNTNRCRTGLTLVEVLVSMGLLTLGLLGVAALFPVGGYYMQTGEIVDRAGALAQSALDDAAIRGHLDPRNWMVINISGAVTIPNDSSGTVGVNAGELIKLPRAIHQVREEYAERAADSGLLPQGVSIVGRNEMLLSSAMVGSAFVIDPLGMASILKEPDTSGSGFDPRIWTKVQGAKPTSEPTRRFPATDAVHFTATGQANWNPWVLSNVTWPVRRAMPNIAPEGLDTATFFLHEPIAEALYTASDNPAQMLPEGGDDPARQRQQTWSDGTSTYPASRQTRNEFSWLFTVSPGSNEARNALASSPDAYPYDVSAVVFHKRILGTGYDGALEAERLVRARVVSTSAAGGELLLEKRPGDTQTLSPFEELREGEFVMLTGPHPMSTDNRPMLFLQWYKVLSIEDSTTETLNGTTQTLDGEQKVLVSLRGPDWPWQPGTNLATNTLLANDLRVGIIPGAVAVHTKTMRLESGTDWSE